MEHEMEHEMEDWMNATRSGQKRRRRSWNQVFPKTQAERTENEQEKVESEDDDEHDDDDDDDEEE